MRCLIPLALALGLLAGCAAVPRTPDERLIVAETAYQGSVDAMLAYVAQPGTSSSMKAIIHRLNEHAHDAMIAARAAHAAGRTPDVDAVVSRSDAMKAVIASEGK